VKNGLVLKNRKYEFCVHEKCEQNSYDFVDFGFVNVWV
jgi:hypothetical protein